FQNISSLLYSRTPEGQRQQAIEEAELDEQHRAMIRDGGLGPLTALANWTEDLALGAASTIPAIAEASAGILEYITNRGIGGVTEDYLHEVSRLYRNYHQIYKGAEGRTDSGTVAVAGAFLDDASTITYEFYKPYAELMRQRGAAYGWGRFLG